MNHRKFSGLHNESILQYRERMQAHCPGAILEEHLTEIGEMFDTISQGIKQLRASRKFTPKHFSTTPFYELKLAFWYVLQTMCNPVDKDEVSPDLILNWTSELKHAYFQYPDTLVLQYTYDLGINRPFSLSVLLKKEYVEYGLGLDIDKLPVITKEDSDTAGISMNEPAIDIMEHWSNLANQSEKHDWCWMNMLDHRFIAYKLADVYKSFPTRIINVEHRPVFKMFRCHKMYIIRYNPETEKFTFTETYDNHLTDAFNTTENTFELTSEPLYSNKKNPFKLYDIYHSGFPSNPIYTGIPQHIAFAIVELHNKFKKSCQHLYTRAMR